MLLTSLFAVVRACHPAENGRWYLSGARLCLKHNVALEPDKAMINDDDYDGGDGDDKSFQVQQQRTYLSSAS